MTDQGEWREATASNGQPYYWNTSTRATQWERPPSLQNGAAGKRNKQNSGPKAKAKRGKQHKPPEDEEDEEEEDGKKTTIKMKLKTSLQPAFCDTMMDVFQGIVNELNLVIHEGYLVANYHFNRCFQEEDPTFPDLNQTFFYRCLSLNAENDARLGETIRRFNELRPDGHVLHDRLRGLNDIMSAVAKQMLTATKNHIILNFKSRLLKYVRRKYDLATKYEAYQFVAAMFDEDWTDAHAVEDQLELKAWLDGINPFLLEYKKISRISTDDLQMYLEKLYDMACLQEELPPDTKGKKTFTLLPTKHDWQLSHIPLEKSHIRAVMRRVPSEVKWQMLQVIVANQENHPPPQVLPREQQLGLDRLADALRNGRMTDLFFQNSWCQEQVWNCIFDFKSMETKSKKFSCYISTNGYEVCAVFDRIKPNDAPASNPTDAATIINNNEPVAFDHYIGIDPGKTFVMNSFDGIHFNKLSSREYYRRIKNTERQKWNENLKNRNQEYANLIRDMPSLKTTNVVGFEAAIRVHLERAPELFAFAQSLPFRKWRFKIDRFRRKTLDKLCNDTVGHLEGSVCVGIGDWSQPKGFKGLPSVPLKRMFKAFKQQAKNKSCRTRDREKRQQQQQQQHQPPGAVNNQVPRQRDDKVVMVREFNTSAVCSGCEQPVKMFHVKHRGVAVRKSKRERLERMGQPVPVPDKAKLTESHQVVRCSNNACSICWQRDINAARNIRKLLRLEQTGQPRPDVFSRQLPMRG